MFLYGQTNVQTNVMNILSYSYVKQTMIVKRVIL